MQFIFESTRARIFVFVGREAIVKENGTCGRVSFIKEASQNSLECEVVCLPLDSAPGMLRIRLPRRKKGSIGAPVDFREYLACSM